MIQERGFETKAGENPLFVTRPVAVGPLGTLP